MEGSVFELTHRPAVAVLGPGEASTEQLRAGRRIGRLLAESGVIVITGGGSGVMEAACQGAMRGGGITIGILPGGHPAESPPNAFVQVPIYTGMGEARNAVIVRSAGAVIAVGGGFGTLSEIALALKAGRPVILLDSWRMEPPAPTAAMAELLHPASNPLEAVQLAVALSGALEGSTGNEDRTTLRQTAAGRNPNPQPDPDEPPDPAGPVEG